MADIQVTANSEEGLIGAVLRDGTQYTKLREIVRPDHFQNHAYANAWLACEHLHERGMGVDTITVGDELERMGKLADFVNGMWSGRALLSDLRQNGTPRNAFAYAENVHNAATKRELLQIMNEGAQWSMNGRLANDIIHDLTARLSQLQPYSQQDEYTVPIGVGASEAYDWTNSAARGEIVGVPTGLTDLDNILGSMIAGNVYIVAARPKQGKTGLLVSIVRNVAKSGKRVGMFSLEMSRQQIAQRLICQEAEVDLHRAILGKLEPHEWAKYTNGLEHVSAMPIVINDLSSINIHQITHTARKIKATGLDLLVVDYLQLANADNKRYERRDLEVSAVSRGLKYLARELNVPILAAAQLSRAVEQRTDKKPILSDLRESGSLEQDAYAVMFIHRKDEEPTTPEIIVAAHRNGPTGTCSLKFNGSLTRFDNLYQPRM